MIEPKAQIKATIVLRNEDEMILIDKKKILFAEVNQGQLTIETMDESYTTRQTLKSLMEQLPPNDFIQISKHSLVRVQAIKRLEVAFSGNLYAFLSNGRRITVSRRFVSDLKNYLGI